MLTVKANPKIVVALSGGPHSAAAAALLKSQGYEVIAIFFRFGSESFRSHCVLGSQLESAKRVAEKLGLSLQIAEVEAPFEAEVVDYFVHECLQLRSPSPCVRCNSRVKFEYLLKAADRFGCSQAATGHRAQIFHDLTNSSFRVSRGVEPSRDQSFLLFELTQSQLQRCVFPMGALTHAMTLKIVREFDLFPEGQTPTDSGSPNGACFINDPSYRELVAQRVDRRLRPPGSIQREDGSVVGTHDGLYGLKIGQSQDLELNLPPDEAKSMVVVGFDAARNGAVVSDESALLSKTVLASKASWLSTPPGFGIRGLECEVQAGSNFEANPCRVTFFENSQVRVEFSSPQRSLSPGQSLAFYLGDELLGGAYISEIEARAGSKRGNIS